MSSDGEPPPAFPFTDRLVAWQKDGRCTDVVLVSNEEDESERQQFAAHSFLISLASPVMERMLETNMQEGRERRIVLPFPRDVVRRAVHYFYRGPASLEWPEHGSDASRALREKAMQNLGIADYLQCEELRSECERWMVDDLECDPHYYFDHACLYRLPTMETAAWKKMADHSDCYFGHGGFVELCYERFEQLMNDVRAYFMQAECHDGDKESMLYIDTVKWIEHNKPTEERATSLLSLLRFDMLHPTFLVDVVGQEPIVQRNLTCLDMFMKAVAGVVKRCLPAPVPSVPAAQQAVPVVAAASVAPLSSASVPPPPAAAAPVRRPSKRTLGDCLAVTGAPRGLFIAPAALAKKVKRFSPSTLGLIVLFSTRREMSTADVMQEVLARFDFNANPRVLRHLKVYDGLVRLSRQNRIVLGPNHADYKIGGAGNIVLLPMAARGRS